MTPPPSPHTNTMNPQERRASISLAAVYALRMLGLFLILPVFVQEAKTYPGGHDMALIGLAMGAYGLGQVFLQIPLGWASDRWGRKRVILCGLVVYALGSLVATQADSVMGLLIGRVLQGVGAIGAAITALLSDLTRDEVRTKAMALVGMSIGLTFVLSLIFAPILADAWGLRGIFGLTLVLCLLAMATIYWITPNPSLPPTIPSHKGAWREVFEGGVWRLHVGVFVLHALQMAMWLEVPDLLTQAGVLSKQHAWVYLVTAVLGLVCTGGVFALERKGYLVWVLRCAMLGLVVVELAFYGLTHFSWIGVGGGGGGFNPVFCGF